MVHLFVPLYILRNKPDLVVNDLGHAIPWLSTAILRKRSLVFFRHLHARSLPGQVSKLFGKLITAIEKCYFIIYPNCKFITESTTSIEDIIKLGIKNENVIRITPGVNPEIYKLSEKSELPKLVYFGGMRKYKRPIEVIHIFNELLKRFTELNLVVIGTGPELAQVEKLTEFYGILDHVRFVGRVSDNILSDTISHCWVNLHTSVTEGWGLSILEASAAGTPTVAYSVPGVVDVIEDEKNGIKVKEGDRNAFVDAVSKILMEPDRWWQSSRRVAEKYSWDDTARMWAEVINREIK